MVRYFAAEAQIYPTGCVTWINGLPDQDIIGSANNLCAQNLLPNVIDFNTLYNFKISDASLFTTYALYYGNIPNSLPSDNFPTLFGDINNLSFSEYQAIKAMCFLEYGDGRSCFPRDFNSIRPHDGISIGYILRMLYEAWNVPPDNQGYNIFDASPSDFLSNINKNDYNYGYYRRAFYDNFLWKYIVNGQLIQIGIRAGDFYIYLLNEINNKYGFNRPPITDDSFYKPNNIQLNNSTTPTDLTRAVFKTYEQTGFHMPSGGIGIDFNFSYHSDWLDMPTLGYSSTNNVYEENNNYIDERAKEHNFPLGLGWTHTYNIVAQSLLDNNNRDNFIVIRWGDGSIEVYNTVNSKFESVGLYDNFVIDNMTDGHISSFHIVRKDQSTILFTSSANNSGNPYYFQAIRITDIHGNIVNLYYESANCLGDPAQCYGTNNRRLLSVKDNYSGRSLNFYYQPGTDLLDSVTDEFNRSIKFNVDRTTLNLSSVTNARRYTTQYAYGNTDADNHLLLSIKRPNGNTITNTYYERKLTQTQTPDYLASISFTPSYSSPNISTQSIITTSPSAGNQYTITYNHNALGTVSTISSASTNLNLAYGDNNNPTLPTQITDNFTGAQQNIQYDPNGNITQSAYTRNGLRQSNSFTYDPQNNMTSHTWPNGTTMYYQYQSGNRINERALNYNIDYGYFNGGLLATKTDANQVTTNYAYNQFGNLRLIAFDKIPIQVSAEYDGTSRIRSITDGDGIKTTYEHDENNNLKKIVEDTSKLELTTDYTYDKNDNLQTITPPLGDVITLDYNNSDDLADEKQGPLERQWGYNDDGTLNSYTDKANNSFSYLYYPKNDPNEGKLKSNGYQNFIYDNSDRLLTTINTIRPENGTINYNYDALLRVNDVRFTAPDFQSEVSYQYDVSGNLTALTLQNEGKSIYYEYDGLNRIISIKDWNHNPVVQYTYQNNGLLINESFSNGASVYYHYDAINRLDSIYCLKNDPSKTLIYAVGCSMDNNGNHIRESSSVNWPGSPNYFQAPQPDLSATYDTESRLTSINNQSVTSDKNGNITQNLSTGFTNGTYDQLNRLTNCSVNGKAKIFLYDALGSRYGTDSLRYTIDNINNSNVLAIRKIGQSSAAQIYIYSPFGLVCSIDPQSADPTYYLYDFRGSTLARIDKNESIVDYYKYDPWGNISEASFQSGNNPPFLFVGKYGVMYSGSHLYYMRARYYDPYIKRFLSEDPKWNINLFSYSGNNPLSNIDPTGNSIINWISSYLYINGNLQFSRGTQFAINNDLFGINFDPYSKLIYEANVNNHSGLRYEPFTNYIQTQYDIDLLLRAGYSKSIYQGQTERKLSIGLGLFELQGTFGQNNNLTNWFLGIDFNGKFALGYALSEELQFGIGR